MRVIKSANVYNSVTDLASFVDDIIKTVSEAQRQGFSADPNQTVQAFIDLCARHEDDFYKFVHEMHKHDNGLFDALMGHIEGILAFLRTGPKGGALDMNALFKNAIEQGTIDQQKATREVNSLIKWQIKRKRWHQDKTRQKMAEAASSSDTPNRMPGFSAIRPSDFGVEEEDLSDLDESVESWSGSESEDEDGSDGILAEQKRRARQARLRSGAGEPVKPPIGELNKLMPGFMDGLRGVLAE
jgi:polyhydroxyalkanoate synthesis regulator phasin